MPKNYDSDSELESDEDNDAGDDIQYNSDQGLESDECSDTEDDAQYDSDEEPQNNEDSCTGDDGQYDSDEESENIEDSCTGDDAHYDSDEESENNEDSCTGDDAQYDSDEESQNNEDSCTDDDTQFNSDEESGNSDESELESERDSPKPKLKRFDARLLSKNGMNWFIFAEPSKAGRPMKTSHFRGICGPTGYAQRKIMKDSPLSAFKCLISEEILDEIIDCTETEAKKVRSEANYAKPWKLGMPRLLAFFAILYARGAYEAKNLKLSYLWSDKWGIDFFKKTMSRNDFTEIMRFLRFDRRDERPIKMKNDKFCMISTIWNQFIKNSIRCYNPSANITVDEQLFPTKARCPFTQYMPNKPDKFGIKFWLASDVDSKYIVNALPYLGKDSSRKSGLGQHVVLKLLKPYYKSHRNVITDSFFTSSELGKELLSKKLFLTGTIRKNRKEIPPLASEQQPLHSTTFLNTNEQSLTIYQTKKNKSVLILSTLFVKDLEVTKGKKKLPNTIEFYNKNKFGVDISDQMCKKYSVKSSSRRYPLQIFFNMLDMAGINAWILYKESTGSQVSRKDFLFLLAEEMASENSVERVHKTNASPPLNTNRKWCQVNLCNNNKAKHICYRCSKVVCGSCTSEIRVSCKKCEP